MLGIRLTVRARPAAFGAIPLQWIGILALIGMLSWPASPADAERPNLVLIMVDDLGKEWVGCYGGEDVQTPAVDRLAREGLRFHNAWSMPQCTPTRATLLTGQYPFRHGWVNHWDVPRWGRGCHFDPERNPSIAKMLQSAGYRTCVAGKWQINDFRIQPNVLAEVGFDEHCVWTGYETGNPRSGKRYQDPYLHTSAGSRVYEGEYGPDVCNRFLLDFIDRQSPEQPFFVYYPMLLTHGPLTPTPAKPDVEGGDRFRAMVEYMDHLTGKLVEKLEQKKVRRNTLIVWTTDNGSPRGIRNRRNGQRVAGGKGLTLETGIDAPLIASWPARIAPGSETAALVDFTDLLPTFAELAAAQIPDSWVIDGRSFASVLADPKQKGHRDWILSMGGGPGTYDSNGRVINRYLYRDRVIRDARFKLYVETNRAPIKLVDLANDPEEKTNLLPAMTPEATASLQRLLAVEADFPNVDASPKYDPLPPQPWDVKQPNPGRRQGPRGIPGLPSNDGNR